MKSFNEEQRKKEVIHSKRSESITTEDFTEYSTSDPFYYSARELFYPDYLEPTLVIDFFSEQLHSLINFSRSSEATHWNSSGNLVTVSNDEPRFDYNPKTLEKMGLLREESSENYILDSRDGSTANWTSNGVSVSRDAVGIDGNANTAFTVTGTTGTDDFIEQAITISSNTDIHTGYAFLKKNQDQDVQFRLDLDNTTVISSAVIDTNTGEKSQENGVINVEDYGDWWLIWGTVSNDSTATTLRIKLFAEDNSGSTIWDQAQVELDRNYPTSPIITGGSTKVRDTEFVNITDLSFLNRSQGTFIFDAFYRDIDDIFPILSLSDNTIENKIEVSYLNDEIRYVFTQDTNTTQVDVPILDNTKDFKKLSFTYNDENKYDESNEDNIVTETNVNNVNWANSLKIGSNYNSSDSLNSHIRKIFYYNYELSKGQLEEITIL